MTWLAAALISAALFSVSNGFTKVFQSKLGTGFGMILFSLGVLASSIFITYVLKIGLPIYKQPTQTIQTALIAGLVWGFAQLFFIIMLGKNAPMTVALPIVVGGIGVGGILTGVLFFGEQMTVPRLIGATIVLIGTVILSRS